MTALCPNVDLGTAAVILPWHDPLRVAEQAAVLDMLSKGRLRLGLVCPKATAKVAKIGRFRDWLLAEAADDARRLGEAERRRR